MTSAKLTHRRSHRRSCSGRQATGPAAGRWLLSSWLTAWHSHPQPQQPLTRQPGYLDAPGGLRQVTRSKQYRCSRMAPATPPITIFQLRCVRIVLRVGRLQRNYMSEDAPSNTGHSCMTAVMIIIGMKHFTGRWDHPQLQPKETSNCTGLCEIQEK